MSANTAFRGNNKMAASQRGEPQKSGFDFRVRISKNRNNFAD